MPPLRVLEVSDFYLPRAGGVERVVAESARCLVASGIEVEVLTRRLDPEAPARERIAGVPVARVGPGPAPFPLELASIARGARAWARTDLSRFDLVHAHLSLVASTLLDPIRSLCLPLVATYYGPWHREYLEEMRDPEVPSRWPRALRSLARPAVAAILRRIQSRVLRAADRIVVLSEHSSRELAAELGIGQGAAVERVPGGVDIERFAPRPRAEAAARLELSGSPLLVSVRRLVPRMGLEALIDAVARLAPRHPRLALAVAGRGPLAEALARRAQAVGVGKRVRLLGAVADDDLPWLYAAADLTVVPTRALEGFGLPVLESWAAGVPAVATPVGALAERVAELDPAFLAAGTDAAALEAAIERALGRIGPSVSERARALARSYRWEDVTSRLAAVYHRVSSERREA